MEPIPVKFSRLGADLLTRADGATVHPADIQRGDVVQIGALLIQVTKTPTQSIKSSYLTYHIEGITTQ